MGNENFEVVTRDKNRYEITPHIFETTGLTYYTTVVEGQKVAFIGNPNILDIGPLLVTYDPLLHKEITLPYDFPSDVELSELEDIAEAIENYFL